jgi:23S rRNA U2552 (ribose-2'-O)-methylase RlmE/FtsJ
MASFLLPSVPYKKNVEQLINIQTNINNNNKPIINRTLNTYLNNIKIQIETDVNNWDKYKKYTNPYEYIHTIIPNTKQSVSKLKPLSRSFYKMIEITNMLDLIDKKNSLQSFHLAEGPGGFIEAMCLMRENREDDKYYGMTLIDNNDPAVPGWNKTNNFLLKNQNVIIEKGHDQTGNIMNADNLKYCYEKYKNSFDIITGDGGFDFSMDFNQQELVSSKLIFCQIAFAISLQKQYGHFVLKVFDTFTKVSIEFIYLLSLLYDEVYIVKPNTSRYANSEKYIVCKNFRLSDTSNLVTLLYSVISNLKEGYYFNKILNVDVPYLYFNKLEEYNAIIGQQQIENIASTLSLISNSKHERLELLKKNNIQKSILWCQKYKIPYHKNIQFINIFINRNVDTELNLE